MKNLFHSLEEKKYLFETAGWVLSSEENQYNMQHNMVERNLDLQ